jgi:hypothetical protein
MIPLRWPNSIEEEANDDGAAALSVSSSPTS